MWQILAALAMTPIAIVFFCLLMLYYAIIILFVICTFAGFFAGLAIYEDLQQLGRQIWS